MTLKDKLILIIDNDDLTLKMLDMVFRATGARVLLENDCRDASSVLDQTRPDIIILNLSEIDLEKSIFCKQMQEKFSNLEAPVIVTSTIPVSQYNKRLTLHGTVHYFQKPYSSFNLRNKVYELLEAPIPTNMLRPFQLQAE